MIGYVVVQETTDWDSGMDIYTLLYLFILFFLLNFLFCIGIQSINNAAIV